MSYSQTVHQGKLYFLLLVSVLHLGGGGQGLFTLPVDVTLIFGAFGEFSHASFVLVYLSIAICFSFNYKDIFVIYT
jgi:hypothetical protein